METVIRACLLALALVPPHFAYSAASTTLGSSDASRCFQESQFALSDTGIEYCNRAIASGNLTRRDLAATYSNRGIIYSNIGKYQNALADHNKAIEIMPDLAEAYINRGNVYYHTHDYALALSDYETASSKGARPAHTPYYNKALTLIRLNRKDDAKAAFENALEHSPESTKIKQQLAELDSL
ncbi:MAG: tetratricopeptide repeat protein [Pseudomonadales bacterium]